MGCDIHMYVEYQRGGRTDWSNWGARINPGRDYELFGKLAGVRRKAAPLVPLRGIPSDISFMTDWDWWLWISEKNPEHEEFCTLAKAIEWKEHGCRIEERDGKPYRVEHPDWHDASWVTPSELGNALEAPAEWSHDDSYWALLAAMFCLEQRGNKVRVVFWFDN